MKRVVVYCGSSNQVPSGYIRLARQMGRAVASADLTLVYGGGRTGLMGAVADAALESGGKVIGVTIGQFNNPEIGHQNLTELLVMDSMRERKAKMIELADGCVTLPGGLGTLDELIESLAWAQLGLHRKPVGLLNADGYFDPLLAMLDHARSEGFLYSEQAELLVCDTQADRLIDRMSSFEPQIDIAERWRKQSEEVE